MKKELTDQEMEEWLISIKTSKLAFDLLPSHLYDWMWNKQKTWTRWDDAYNMKEAVQYRQRQLHKDAEKDRANNRILSAFMRMKETGEFSPEEKSRLETIAKRILIMDYLNAMK